MQRTKGGEQCSKEMEGEDEGGAECGSEGLDQRACPGGIAGGDSVSRKVGQRN